MPFSSFFLQERNKGIQNEWKYSLQQFKKKQCTKQPIKCISVTEFLCWPQVIHIGVLFKRFQIHSWSMIPELLNEKNICHTWLTDKLRYILVIFFQVMQSTCNWKLKRVFGVFSCCFPPPPNNYQMDGCVVSPERKWPRL